MSVRQTIPCPDCDAQIPIETRALMEGAAFACPNCAAEVSKVARAEESWGAAQEKFGALKAAMLAAQEGKA